MKNLVLLATAASASTTPNTLEIFEGFLVGGLGYSLNDALGSNL